MKKTKNHRGMVIVASIAFANLMFRIGQANGSGIGKYLYFIPNESILRWPAIVNNMADAATEESYVCYSGNFKIDENAHWIRIYNTQGEGVMTAEPLGERDSRMFMNKLSFRYPKLTIEAAVLSNAVVNGDGVFVGWHDGAYRVVGNRQYRCDVTPNVTSGDTAGSSKGVTFEAACPDFKALPIYRGTLLLDDGILDCATDTFITPDKQADFNDDFNDDFRI